VHQGAVDFFADAPVASVDEVLNVLAAGKFDSRILNQPETTPPVRKEFPALAAGR